MSDEDPTLQVTCCSCCFFIVAELMDVKMHIYFPVISGYFCLKASAKDLLLRQMC